jgi:D-arabinono-1,4-lactone oxidase
MANIQHGADGFFHPANEDEIVGLIQRANRENLKIRVRGSGHSVWQAIFTDNFQPNAGGTGGIDIMLDQLSFDKNDINDKVKIDAKKMTVIVKAGCHLGQDPYDPAGVSSRQNSLLYQLDQAGFAVPDLGGIIHQAVGGFISTGSSGGSLHGSFGESIIGLKLVDGTGKIHTLTRESGDDNFFAAGVSMGLLGIITEVTFKLVEKFNIIGEQTTTTVADCTIDLFGNGSAGKPSLKDFLYQTRYTRLMWWPQKKVERMVVWKAKVMEKADYNAQTGTPENFKPKPYWEFPVFPFGGTPNIPSEGPSEKLAEGAGGLFYSIAGNWHQAIKSLQLSFLAKVAMKIVGWLYPKHILPAVLNAFNPLDTDPDPITKQPSGPQKFWDYWWSSLPMDNRVDDKLVPTDFTEIWIPISRTAEVMRTMRDYYKKKGLDATGSYSCELYAAKKSDFWMSPSYNEDMFRVDIFWFGYNAGDPAQVYYPQFWKLLVPEFPCRFHWGKYMPVDPNYQRRQYPKWDAFMALREQMDPNQIFVTQYWRERLGIKPKP